MKKILIILISFGFATIASLSAHDHDGHGRNAMAGDHFKKMDANGDNKVSKEEWQKFHDGFFTELDKDADGSVTLEEMRASRMEKREEKKEEMKEKVKEAKAKKNDKKKKPSE
ncbi:EF-hand domain-containing protein [Leptospira bourretii]|uniref:EF-hand domain-containing protein n=1 Tax=Leptospira bourretii TaxID=2484962 RepID=A0A4R9IIQ0_9LEPT|nr:EF-hand domain-containing protein [Leptospira bourretii]TGK88320.1 EF-hand domain-containing protein [Leptospira bourretii]TGK88969.1 EF-hand domain-containing protein [Leptospira bourretii]TGL21259.1 EF-hand domain-containing protein [Leptospira bourretii]TGL37909.1 EF-hand domain-containing protein [Leptospira bourretii]